MYKIIDEKGVIYSEYQYADETEYEKMVVANSDLIFGTQGIYFDILYFKDSAKKIKNVTLSGQTKGKAPQAPRYTTYAKLLEANNLDDLWK